MITIAIIRNDKPFGLGLNIRTTLLHKRHVLTCDCGKVAWIHRLPFRCTDCGEWWFHQYHIEHSKAVLVQPKIEQL